ncbi:MAG: hypothetical protein AMJ95_00985 [Omnitrophica WOR_2 bacterium SM23_72]|nr:MAG: hypothetical protein AMJ95_00985 [Omnitrophica WOR_2 bacterium SM23_72]
MIFLLSYAVVWLFLASPYRFIPCDDKIFLEPIFNHIPLFQFFLKSIRAVFCAIGNTENSLQMALVWQAILSNIFILSSTVWIIFCLRYIVSDNGGMFVRYERLARNVLFIRFLHSVCDEFGASFVGCGRDGIFFTHVAAQEYFSVFRRHRIGCVFFEFPIISCFDLSHGYGCFFVF